MNIYVILLMCIISDDSRALERLVEDVDENGFIQAVLSGYDVNVSFSDNFYSLLGAICPASVYCPGNTTHEIESRVSPETEEVVFNARSILRNNAHKLRGCCSACSCDANCQERHDCCPVMETDISDSDFEKPDQPVLQECVYANLKYYFPGGRFATADKTGWSFFMVTDCFSPNASEETVTKCKRPDIYKPDETRPVYSAVAGRLYKNMFCAFCNEVTEFVALISVVVLYGQFSLTGSLKVFSSPDELYALAIRSHRRVDIYYKPPVHTGFSDEQYACVPSWRTETAVEVCQSDVVFYNDQHNIFKRACNMQRIFYHTQTVWFNNVFCSICSNNIYGDRGNCGITGREPTLFSFSALLRYDQSQLSSAGEANADGTKAPCKCTEYFEETKKRCRRLMCPPSTVFVSCTCKEFLEDMTRMAVKLYIQITPNIPGSWAQEVFGGHFDSDIRKAIDAEIVRVLKSRWVSFESEYTLLFREMYSHNKELSKVHGVVLANFKDKVDFRKVVQGVFNDLVKGVWAKVLNVSVRISLGWNFDVIKDPVTTGKALSELINDTSKTIIPMKPIDRDFTDASIKLKFSQTVNKLVYCKRVELENEEIALLQNDSDTLGVSESYLLYVFWKEDRSMCIDDFKNVFEPNSYYAPPCWCFDTMLFVFVLWNNVDTLP